MAAQCDPIRGVIAPTLTPFNDDLGLAQDLYVRHAQHLLANGCAGLAPFGTTSEALSIGIEERIQALDALIGCDVDPAKLIPGTGLTNLMDTARLTRHAMDRGCVGAMVLPPFYIKDVSDDGLFAYYARLIERVGHDVRIYLYHIPHVSHVPLSVELVGRLRSAFPAQIVGIKDSSGDWNNTRRLLTEVPGLIVYSGSELPLFDALALGAAGCITATANTNAAQIDASFSLYRSGRRDEAARHHESVKAYRLKIQEFGQIPGQKYLLSVWEKEPRWRHVCPPLVDMTDEVGRRLLIVLQEIGFAPTQFTQV